MYSIGISKIQINRWKEKYVAKNYSVINGFAIFYTRPWKNCSYSITAFQSLDWPKTNSKSRTGLSKSQFVIMGQNSVKAGFILRANLSFPALRMLLNGPKYLKKLWNSKVMKLAQIALVWATKGQQETWKK